MTAICCPTCGRADLSEGTGALDLRLPLALLAWGAAFGILLPLARAVAPPALSWLYLTGKGLLNLGIVCAVLLYLLPGRLGEDVRRGVGRSVRAVWRLIVGLHVLRSLSRLALRLGTPGSRSRRH